jgi:hypothetical protein
MKTKGVLLLLMLALQPVLQAREWFAAPSATATGDGSINNPWPLQVALAKQSVIQPGDTLYLRGGSYIGPGFRSILSGTSDNYITVRSAMKEWAVITDGAVSTLLTNLLGTNAPYSVVDNVSISGSQFWSLETVVMIGIEQLQIYGHTGTNCSLIRGWNGTAVTTHTNGEIVRLRSNFITHTGSYVKFQDFEITAGGSTNRIVGTNNYVGCGLNLPSPGKGNKAINLIIHNVGHPGIGFWNQGNGGEINGCIMWGNGIYANEGAWTRGTSVYAQNETGTVYLKNNIVFRNFTEGMQAYGTAASTKGFRFINNISMMNGNGFGIACWNEGVPMSDNAMWTNYFGLDRMVWGYTSVSNITMSCLGNVLAKPPNINMIKYHTSGEFKWNTLLFDGHGVNSGMLSVQYPDYALSNMSFTIDNNAYYYTNQDTYLFVLATLDHPADRLTFTQWKSATGFDANSTLQIGFPTNYSNVQAMQLDYDSTKHYVVVVSTSGTNTAYLNLASLGYKAGDGYELRDAQNYFAVIAAATYTSGTLALPLNLTNVATINGTLTHYTNKHTNVKEPDLFNAFVLRRIPRLGPPTSLLALPPP